MLHHKCARIREPIEAFACSCAVSNKMDFVSVFWKVCIFSSIAMYILFHMRFIISSVKSRTEGRSKLVATFSMLSKFSHLKNGTDNRIQDSNAWNSVGMVFIHSWQNTLWLNRNKRTNMIKLEQNKSFVILWIEYEYPFYKII